MKTYLKVLAAAGFITAMLTAQQPLITAKEPDYTGERNQEYSEIQKDILHQIPEMEQEYLEYGLQAAVSADPKGSAFRTAIGSWNWRPGLICVTTEGFGVGTVGTWHAAIVAAQAREAVVEAPKPGVGVRHRTGVWRSSYHTIWQVGINSTSVQQDKNAATWAEKQLGKLYNLGFWNSRQTESFYCSQLVWAAYCYTCGVDLNKPDNDASGNIAIHPGEFVSNHNTTIVYRNK